MKNKQLIIYALGILIVGILVGWFIFGRNAAERNHLDDHNTATKEDQIWTCSMHPQIRLPEPGDCPICGMDLIPLEVNSNSNPLVFEMTENAIKIANIQTTVIGTSVASSNGIKVSGKIKADETNSASIVSHIAGRIEKLYISYTGEKVSKGQKIASIYSPKLITAQKELLEAYKVKESNPKLYEATVNKLKFWKLTSEQIQAIVTSSKVIESFSIYAGFSGVVLNKRVSVGDYLNEGEVLFDIQNLSQLWAVFDVYETDLGNIKTGTKINFSTPAIPNKTFTAVISFIDPVINPNTRTAAVRTSINNASQLLKPEMFLEGIISTASNSNQVISVPKTAVLWTGEKSVVYIKLPNLIIPSFEFREVTLGESTGASYIVLGGLNNGDEVVTNGAFVIDASAQLNNQSSMMNRKLVNMHVSAAIKEIDAPAQFVIQLEGVLADYIKLKNALVQSNSKLASRDAQQCLKSLDKVEMKLLKDNEAHKFWMSQYEIIIKKLDLIVKEGNLKTQRSAFEALSNAIITSAKNFGVNQMYFVQFCPMSSNGRGSHWLSDKEKIMNPYFGDEMLNCGSVLDTIKK